MVRATLVEVDFSTIDPDYERQAAYASHAAGAQRAKRQGRLQDLERRRGAIGAAVAAYQRIDHGEVPEIRVREQFVRLENARPSRGVGLVGADEVPPSAEVLRRRDLASRPPLTRLVHRGGGALRLYLSALYVAHLELAPRERFRNDHGLSTARVAGVPSWATLAGMAGDGAPRARRARANRALDELARIELVALGSGAQKYETFTLLAETGDTSAYTRPGERAPATIALPASFFLNGWHLVLTPAEVAMLLVVRSHRRRIYRGDPGIGVTIAESDRDTLYGVTGEVYQAVHTLAEFDLLKITDTMPNRRRGRVRSKPADADPEASATPVPYHLVALDRFDRDPVSVVRHALRANPIPLRLTTNPSYAD